jgi:hypothetical protein
MASYSAAGETACRIVGLAFIADSSTKSGLQMAWYLFLCAATKRLLVEVVFGSSFENMQEMRLEEYVNDIFRVCILACFDIITGGAHPVAMIRRLLI